MAGRFSDEQWDKIENELLENPKKWGVPEGGREESVVFASFNIRKLGRSKGRERELEFMARFCSRCDLIAIQEVQDELSGLRYLQKCMDERVASFGEFGLVVSDITGKVPGGKGMQERLAFLYRKSRVRHLDMTSDLTVDRTGVLRRLKATERKFKAAWTAYEKKLKNHKYGPPPSKPSFELPNFLTFARTPHVTAFKILAAGDADPVSFIAVNAHLIYGKMRERKAEFRELVRWIAMRLRAEEKMVAPNYILLGDLNMDLDNPKNDRQKTESYIGDLKQQAFNDRHSKRIYFPFIGDHPRTNEIVRTNARHSQTFDQIGFFLGRKEKRLPMLGSADNMGKDGPDGFDYDVFDFAELFAQAIESKPYQPLPKKKKDEFSLKFIDSVSDHMPIWVRIPRPGF